MVRNLPIVNNILGMKLCVLQPIKGLAVYDFLNFPAEIRISRQNN